MWYLVLTHSYVCVCVCVGLLVRSTKLARYSPQKKEPPQTNLAMGQKPVPPVNIPIPTKVGSKMGGAPTPK